MKYFFFWKYSLHFTFYQDQNSYFSYQNIKLFQTENFYTKILILLLYKISYLLIFELIIIFWVSQFSTKKTVFRKYYYIHLFLGKNSLLNRIFFFPSHLFIISFLRVRKLFKENLYSPENFYTWNLFFIVENPLFENGILNFVKIALVLLFYN